MESTLQEKFIQTLERKYGAWNKLGSKFGTTSFGVIAKDLSISASQFSKLMYGTATEGMYIRSIANIERLIQYEVTQKELDLALKESQSLKVVLQGMKKQEADFKRKEVDFEVEKASVRRSFEQKTVLYTLLGLLLGVLGMYFLSTVFRPSSTSMDVNSHPLAPYFDLDFDANFDSPYLDESEVQDYCPCSAYEGVWSLSEQYKLPLPGNGKPGTYYLAKSADVRMKCSKSDTTRVGKGRSLLGYEYLVNEIWVDTKMTPLSPTYFDKSNKSFTPTFDALVFEDNPEFRKVATVHSFFIDKFEIYEDSIVRTGEPCGRFASDVEEALVVEYEMDIKHLLENVLGNLVTTNCNSMVNPFCDPNDLKEKESVMNFDCLYTIKTENLGIGGGYPYQKGYRLEKQVYSDNLTCGCGESMDFKK